MYTPEYFKSEDAKKYDWTQTYTFVLPGGFRADVSQQSLDEPESLDDFFDIDDRFIDVDMLVADPAEADRMYMELKERAIRRRKHEIKEAAMQKAMMPAEDDMDDELPEDFLESETRQSSSSEQDRKSEQANKILNILENSTATEKLDFTNGLIGFADKIERRNLDALLPALKLLAGDATDIKKSLLA